MWRVAQRAQPFVPLASALSRPRPTFPCPRAALHSWSQLRANNSGPGETNKKDKKESSAPFASVALRDGSLVVELDTARFSAALVEYTPFGSQSHGVSAVARVPVQGTLTLRFALDPLAQGEGQATRGSDFFWDDDTLPKHVLQVRRPKPSSPSTSTSNSPPNTNITSATTAAVPSEAAPAPSAPSSAPAAPKVVAKAKAAPSATATRKPAPPKGAAPSPSPTPTRAPSPSAPPAPSSVTSPAAPSPSPSPATAPSKTSSPGKARRGPMPLPPLSPPPGVSASEPSASTLAPPSPSPAIPAPFPTPPSSSSKPVPKPSAVRSRATPSPATPPAHAPNSIATPLSAPIIPSPKAPSAPASASATSQAPVIPKPKPKPTISSPTSTSTSTSTPASTLAPHPRSAHVAQTTAATTTATACVATLKDGSPCQVTKNLNPQGLCRLHQRSLALQAEHLADLAPLSPQAHPRVSAISVSDGLVQGIDLGELTVEEAQLAESAVVAQGRRDELSDLFAPIVSDPALHVAQEVRPPRAVPQYQFRLPNHVAQIESMIVHVHEGNAEEDALVEEEQGIEAVFDALPDANPNPNPSTSALTETSAPPLPTSASSLVDPSSSGPILCSCQQPAVLRERLGSARRQFFVCAAQRCDFLATRDVATSMMSVSTVPLCRGHSKPCRLAMVKREGANQGRLFWSCSESQERQCKSFKWLE